MKHPNLSKSSILRRRILVGLAGGLTMGTLAGGAQIALWSLGPAAIAATSHSTAVTEAVSPGFTSQFADQHRRLRSGLTAVNLKQEYSPKARRNGDANPE